MSIFTADTTVTDDFAAAVRQVAESTAPTTKVEVALTEEQIHVPGYGVVSKENAVGEATKSARAAEQYHNAGNHGGAAYHHERAAMFHRAIAAHQVGAVKTRNEGDDHLGAQYDQDAMASLHMRADQNSGGSAMQEARLPSDKSAELDSVHHELHNHMAKLIGHAGVHNGSRGVAGSRFRSSEWHKGNSVHDRRIPDLATVHEHMKKVDPQATIKKSKYGEGVNGTYKGHQFRAISTKGDSTALTTIAKVHKPVHENVMQEASINSLKRRAVKADIKPTNTKVAHDIFHGTVTGRTGNFMEIHVPDAPSHFQHHNIHVGEWHSQRRGVPDIGSKVKLMYGAMPGGHGWRPMHESENTNVSQEALNGMEPRDVGRVKEKYARQQALNRKKADRQQPTKHEGKWK